jgi:hypothetical protein
MYLNTPTGGGGTRFPQVGRSADAPDGIVVSPVKGSAVIWPSVFDDRPLEADQRTTHEAMPVRVLHGAWQGYPVFGFSPDAMGGTPWVTHHRVRD